MCLFYSYSCWLWRGACACACAVLRLRALPMVFHCMQLPFPSIWNSAHGDKYARVGGDADCGVWPDLWGVYAAVLPCMYCYYYCSVHTRLARKGATRSTTAFFSSPVGTPGLTAAATYGATLHYIYWWYIYIYIHMGFGEPLICFQIRTGRGEDDQPSFF